MGEASNASYTVRLEALFHWVEVHTEEGGLAEVLTVLQLGVL